MIIFIFFVLNFSLQLLRLLPLSKSSRTWVGTKEFCSYLRI